MLDSLISGSGVQGKIVIGSKNILKSIVEKSQKSRPNYTDVLWKLFDMTPPIDSKISRLKSAGYVFDYQMDEVKEALQDCQKDREQLFLILAKQAGTEVSELRKIKE